jgi:hypothetical protein
MGHDVRVGAARAFERIGKLRHPVECPFVVDRPRETAHYAIIPGPPCRIETDLPERIADKLP